MTNPHLRTFTLAALLVLPLGTQALTIVTDRATLGADDWVDWSTAGHIFTIPTAGNTNSYLPSAFEVASDLGMAVTVSLPAPAPGISKPLVFQTKSGPAQIPTNFASGDYVLFSGLQMGPMPAPGNPGPLTISFATPVRAAGAQLAVDDTLTNFTLYVSAYDATDALLGSFALGAASSIALDNSAAFLGVRGDTANIKTLVYSSSINNRALGMNQLDIASAVPEPGGLFAAGLLILAGRRLRARAGRSALG